MKFYRLSLSRNYVAQWGVIQAVRELIQNALDSDSPFTHEFEEAENGTMTISLHSAGVTLSPRTLLLGVTSKANDEDAIGSFGEGYKIAILVLTRLGHEVIIRNGPVKWTPLFEYDEKFGEEMLVIREEIARPARDGLTFEVYDISKNDVDEIIQSCLFMQPESGNKHTTSFGDILLDRPGRLYIGGLFICKTEMKYGYNVQPKYLKLDRDRQTVDNYDLADLTLRMWSATERYDEIAEMIDKEVDDVRWAKYSANDHIKAACYALFRKHNPDALVAESQEEFESMSQRTLASVVRVNSAMYSAISSYGPYRSNLVLTKVVTPLEELTEFNNRYGEFLPVHGRRDFDVILEKSTKWIAR